ncbi:hypothetical protein C9426_05885 [Serratia sp. S1B]|nr:hypothetical protein C9426_05885 [Serratia sp. S1B]
MKWLYPYVYTNHIISIVIFPACASVIRVKTGSKLDNSVLDNSVLDNSVLDNSVLDNSQVHVSR